MAKIICSSSVILLKSGADTETAEAPLLSPSSVSMDIANARSNNVSSLGAPKINKRYFNLPMLEQGRPYHRARVASVHTLLGREAPKGYPATGEPLIRRGSAKVEGKN